MYTIKKNRLKELKKHFVGKRIAVVGDLMLDGYFWGKVRRVSPEAPVPVVEVENEFFRFGGAANVAYNLVKLGGVPVPFGIVGKDSYGAIFNSLLEDAKISSDCIVTDPERPTTVKTRVMAHTQHVVRIDKESTEPVSKEVQAALFTKLEEQIARLDGVILQDYNKGVLTPYLIEKMIKLANKHNVKVTVDPKFHNFFSYKNVSVFKPNRKEAEDVLRMRIKNDADISEAGRRLLEKLNAQYILLTLGEDGIAVVEKGKEVFRLPTRARKVADVSGAGDTVISTLTMALAAGADIIEASYLANYAGGLVCEEPGIVPIEIEHLFTEVMLEK